MRTAREYNIFFCKYTNRDEILCLSLFAIVFQNQKKWIVTYVIRGLRRCEGNPCSASGGRKLWVFLNKIRQAWGQIEVEKHYQADYPSSAGLLLAVPFIKISSYFRPKFGTSKDEMRHALSMPLWASSVSIVIPLGSWSYMYIVHNMYMVDLSTN